MERGLDPCAASLLNRDCPHSDRRPDLTQSPRQTSHLLPAPFTPSCTHTYSRVPRLGIDGVLFSLILRINQVDFDLNKVHYVAICIPADYFTDLVFHRLIVHILPISIRPAWNFLSFLPLPSLDYVCVLDVYQIPSLDCTFLRLPFSMCREGHPPDSPLPRPGPFFCPWRLQSGKIVKTGDMGLVDQLEAGGYATLSQGE